MDRHHAVLRMTQIQFQHGAGAVCRRLFEHLAQQPDAGVVGQQIEIDMPRKASSSRPLSLRKAVLVSSMMPARSQATSTSDMADNTLKMNCCEFSSSRFFFFQRDFIVDQL